ncbi:MAG: hypothetical protein KJ047_14010 [Anaerolineae bacterium]|nr:hypothetical protein [Anaerolineae bacterium]
MSDSFVELPPDSGPQDTWPDAAAARAVVFEDLTLAQALAYLVWRPRDTARLLWAVLTRDAAAVEPRAQQPLPEMAAIAAHPAPAAEPQSLAAAAFPPVMGMPTGTGRRALAWTPGARATAAWIGVVALAVLLALRGGAALYDAARTPVLRVARNPNGAERWFLLAGVLFVAVELWGARRWWAARLPTLNRRLWARFHANALAHLWAGGLVIMALLLLALALLGLGGLIGAALWVALALILWVGVLLGMTPPLAEPSPDAASDLSPESAGAGGDVFVVQSALRAVEPARAARTAAVGWPARALLIVPATLLSVLAIRWNVARDSLGVTRDVVITGRGALAWALSVALWVVVLVGGGRRLPAMRRAWSWRALLAWPALALIAILALGATFRLYALDSTPPEMTSDHMEKVLDALKVHDGHYAVFFANNGGREAFQMYLVALIAGPLGVGFNFTALKLATVLEGLLTLPALWWMARQVIGTQTERDRALGHWVGIALAGLVAISGWHVMLSRLGLRIVLTPLTIALAIGFLARAMRGARARDFAALGSVLGAGTYFYQANRMLPIVVGIGVALAGLGALRASRERWRWLGEAAGLAALAVVPLAALAYAGSVLAEAADAGARETGETLKLYLPVLALAWLGGLALALRARHDNRLLVLGRGLLIAGVVALALYLPMHHYSQLYPDEFWSRTRGRMFGDNAFVRLDAAGNQVSYEPDAREQAERLWGQRDVFLANYANALRMFHWQGDVAWINNAYSRPALGPTLGGLVLLGAIVWGVWVLRRRDPVLWLLPVCILVMLLPTALTLAYPIENPSFTRASGTLPPVLMLAALPIGALGWRLSRAEWGGRRVPVGRVVALALLALLLWQGIGPEWHGYFDDYRLSYSHNWRPYSEISRPLREFAHGEGSFGNAFVVAYPHWLDHRILGTMAGDIRWPNGLENREALLSRVAVNQGTAYAYDPARPLFVMYNAADVDTAAYLAKLFPGGQTWLFQYSYESGPGIYGQDEFYIYQVWAGELP